MTKKLAITFSAIAGIALLTMGYFAFFHQGRSCGTTVVAGGKGAIGGPFSLVNQYGDAVTDQDVITALMFARWIRSATWMPLIF